MSKIFILDDQISYRSQIEKHLATLPKVVMAGSSRINSGTLSILESSHADILIIELHPTSQAGMKILEDLKQKASPLKTIIALVHEEAQSKRALGLGAKHVLCKKPETDGDEARIAASILDLLSSSLSASSSTPTVSPKRLKAKFANNWSPRAIVIASSTGGPPVLEKIFSQLRPPLLIPVFMVQHMPEFFTRDLAQRLSAVSGLLVREAVDGEEAKAGVCYMAPGNYHMQLVNTAQKVIIRLNQDEKLHSVRPAADFLFHTAATIYARDCLGIVLTGMGADGADGALGIKKLGGHVVIQDKESCAVWGMPGAVHALGAFDAIEDVDSIATILRQSMARNAS